MGIIKAGKYRFNDELEGLSSFTVAIHFYTDTTPEFVLDDAGTPTELTVANNSLHFNTINWNEVIYESGRWFRLQYIPNETFAEMYEQANVYKTEPATLWECFYDGAVEIFDAFGLDVPVSEALKGFGQTITITEDTEVDDTFAQWFAANAVQQADEPPTAEDVKTKLQSLITASNAKTGKSDANLTDAVKTLLEGYGQGGGTGGGGSSVLGARTFNEQRTFPDGTETLTNTYILEGVEGYLYWENAIPDLEGSIYCAFNAVGYRYDTSGTPPVNEKICGVRPVSGVMTMGGNCASIVEFAADVGGIIPIYTEQGGAKYWFNYFMPSEKPPIIIIAKCNNAEAEAWLLANTTTVE